MKDLAMHRSAPLTVIACLSATSLAACSTGEADDGGSTTFSLETNADTQMGDDEVGSESTDGHADETAGTEMAEPDPTCEDGVKNQDETDIDCGGGTCSPCEDGLICSQNSDCISMSCVDGVCVSATCEDGVQNGSETDVDCGGVVCDPCADGLGCVEGTDCVSQVCTDGTCTPPGCGDGVQNGSETDVDCGGPGCDGCAEGEMCIEGADCLSQFCDGGLCAPADCLSDEDCNEFDSDCTEGTCTPDNTCVGTPVNEGSVCDDGDLCSTGEVCSAGTCGSGAPVDCSAMSDDCNVGVCDPMDGSCTTEVANEGNPCDDGNACTVASTCMAGACSDPNEPGYVFHENFADNSQGWTLGNEWQIGAAAASNCALTCPGDDPATDHSSTADNGVAGVLIGGCTNNTVHAAYCLTSPAVDTSVLPDSAWLTFWRHLHSDYPPYMTNTIDVFNGSSWVNLWTSSGSVCINDTEWAEVTYDVTAHKNANFQVRFCHTVGSTGVFTSGSWSVDDVTVGPAVCTP
ncbi:putative lipoprotein [Plesiocystis pacifica SIR-1]|uniref:Putative lipoprotein n=2 Tax=Plesiocystis pacifica TaxID=191768 RepID=A6G8Z6_9BACT|nr:putative lipoprotein [Plesiocystis pacifica SIR-1]